MGFPVGSLSSHGFSHPGGSSNGSFILQDLEFRDGPLGFTLEGSLVVDVQPNSQAQRLKLPRAGVFGKPGPDLSRLKPWDQ